jgi:hypothetical protein
MIKVPAAMHVFDDTYITSMMLILAHFEELSGYPASHMHTGYTASEGTALVMDTIVVMPTPSAEHRNSFSMQPTHSNPNRLSTVFPSLDSETPSMSQDNPSQSKNGGRPSGKPKSHRNQLPHGTLSTDIDGRTRKRKSDIELDTIIVKSTFHQDDWITSVKTRGQLKLLETIIVEPEPMQTNPAGLLDRKVVSLFEIIIAFQRYMLIVSLEERMNQSI